MAKIHEILYRWRDYQGRHIFSLLCDPNFMLLTAKNCFMIPFDLCAYFLRKRVNHENYFQRRIYVTWIIGQLFCWTTKVRCHKNLHVFVERKQDFSYLVHLSWVPLVSNHWISLNDHHLLSTGLWSKYHTIDYKREVPDIYK